LDLRNLKAVQEFITYCKQNLKSLEVLIHNAAQTIKYPVEYYQPLIQKEQQNLQVYHNPKLLGNPTSPIQVQNQMQDLLDKEILPVNRFGQPVDLREKNSWNSKMEEIGLEELLEVNLINQISPYLMVSELRPLMETSPLKERFIINVTSSEGQFSYINKTVFHPHTNMTKAALNMMTRTSAGDFVENGIYMNSVDVGWISTGAHEEKRARLFEKLKIPPLDSVDGAMRIIHPILEIKKGDNALFGKLLKNYKEVSW
jgi:NAD(P)-dependent dehydrogenase (short-subunit alcohol dehydrogenase family)